MLRDRVIAALYEADNGTPPKSLSEARLIYGAKADSVVAVLSEVPPEEFTRWALTGVVLKSGLQGLSATEMQQAAQWDLDVVTCQGGLAFLLSPYKKSGE